MSKALKIVIGVVVAIVVFIAAVFFFVGGQSTKKEIKLGDDRVETMYSAVGKRDVSGVSTSGSQKTITYKSGAVSESDVKAYVNYLRGKGYLVTVAYNGKTIQLGKQSVDTGQIILIDITFDTLGETNVAYKKGTGTITPY